MEVRLGSDGTFLHLRDARLGPWEDEDFGSFVAEVESAGLRATQGVTTYGGEAAGLDGFFRQLADDWRGWDGERSWRSLEGELGLEVQRNGSHNIVSVKLVHGAPRIWTATVELSLEPGEETSRLARDLAEFLAATRR